MTRQAKSNQMTNSNLFDEIGQKIASFKNLSAIEKWEPFEIDFSIPLEKKEKVLSIIKSKLSETQTGIYAIFDGKDCLYIGRGRPIWRRIKAHYFSSKKMDSKAKRWWDFFFKYQKKLKVFWTPFGSINDEKLGDKTTELIEQILQKMYNPKFEE